MVYLYRSTVDGVVVVTLIRIVKSVVTGQAPVTLEWKHTPGTVNTSDVVHLPNPIAEASHASGKNM